jgi:hypothetical protein
MVVILWIEPMSNSLLYTKFVVALLVPLLIVVLLSTPMIASLMQLIATNVTIDLK